MPHVYAVPGNHDLPNHQYNDIERSAYYTLVHAGKVTPIRPNAWDYYGSGRQGTGRKAFAFWGYPCGFPTNKVPQLKPEHVSTEVRLAIVHDYVWSGEGTAFPGVGDEKRIQHHAFFLKDHFDSVLFGDNHIRQDGKCNGVFWTNPGPIMRRSHKERDQNPSVRLLKSDGSFEIHELDASKDKWKDEPTTHEATETDFRELVELLKDLGDSGTDYLNALRAATKSQLVRGSVRTVVWEIVQELRKLKGQNL